MAPQSHVVVTLRLPKEHLEPFDFSDCKPPVVKKARKRPAKPRARPVSNSSKRASDNGGDEDAEDLDTPPASKKLASVEPRGSSMGSGIISGGGADPILGNLPRSVKAAPVANTSGLDLDKTPCRRWSRRPVIWKSFTGFTYNVTAWCSDYSEKELEDKIKREAEIEQSGEKEKSGRSAKRTATPKVVKPKSRKKLEPEALPTQDGLEQQDENADLDQDAASELASDLPSEPPSEAPSQPPAAPSELDSELT